MSNASDVKAAIALLGGSDDDPVVDFFVDPGAACRALDAAPELGGVVARVTPEAGAAAAGYAPPPAEPQWIRVMRGAREVGLAGPRGPAAAGGAARARVSGGSPPDVEGMVRRAERVELDEREESCCDAPGCDRKRARASVWLVLEPITMGETPKPPAQPVAEPGAPGRLLVTEQKTQDGEPGAALAVAARLAAALEVPLQRGGAVIAIEAGEPPAPLGAALGAADLARFALHGEGDLVVLRDWDSAGPRASAARNGWIGAALLVAAAACWAQLWRSLAAGAAAGATAAAGVAAALLTLAGVAFVGVARYSARYRAPCAPLVAVGRDRIVVLPWVGRDGAVDTRPEGLLGAAIALGEVRGASPRPRGDGIAVELDTDHGPIDAMVCPGSPAAELWCAALERVIDEARHPQHRGTARQRARQRAAAAI